MRPVAGGADAASQFTCNNTIMTMTMTMTMVEVMMILMTPHLHCGSPLTGLCLRRRNKNRPMSNQTLNPTT